MVDTEQAVETTLRIISEEYNRVFSPDSVALLDTEQSAIGELTASNDELRSSAKRAREQCEALREAIARTGRRNELDEGRNRDLKERLVTETAAVISALRALGVVLA
jgi:hypothetical protein